MQNVFIFIFTLLLSSFSFAAAAKSSSGNKGLDGLKNLFPHPMVSVSYGTEPAWEIKSETQGLNLEKKGMDLHGSFDFTVLGPLHLIVGYSHTTQNAVANFDYTESDLLIHLTANDVAVKTSVSGPFLGLRIHTFESALLHPYFEGGVVGGIYSVTWAEFPGLYGAGTEIPLKEMQAFWGSYGEGGLELRAYNMLMIGVGYRVSTIKTKAFRTLADQTLLLRGASAFATLGVRF